MSNTFSCGIPCDGGCPNFIQCPYDKQEIAEKDRSVSRNRHAAKIKEYDSAKKGLVAVSSKINNFPEKGSIEEKLRYANKKYNGLYRKVHAPEGVDE